MTQFSDTVELWDKQIKSQPHSVAEVRKGREENIQRFQETCRPLNERESEDFKVGILTCIPVAECRTRLIAKLHITKDLMKAESSSPPPKVRAASPKSKSITVLLQRSEDEQLNDAALRNAIMKMIE